jgi:hypothetical protein
VTDVATYEANVAAADRPLDLQTVAGVTGWLYNPNSLDAKAWQWSFDRPQADINFVKISFIGQKKLNGDVGFAFDNFKTYSEDIQSKNFGVFQLAKIGDFVFEDTNGDGIQDSGEAGVEGITVTLLDGNGIAILDGNGNPITTTTDINGNYSFDVTPGTYSVKFDLPTGYDGFSLANQGKNDALDSDVNSAGVTGTYTVKSGEVNNTIDAGVYELATIGDFVFEDKNGDGIQDDGEGGVEGITVTLLDKNGTPILDGTGNPITTTTDADGKYSFEVIPGTYSVKFSDFPAKYNGYVFSPSGKADDTFDSDADTTGITDTVTVTSGETNNDLDAGLFLEPIIPTGSISNFVWKDTNRNGVQDEGEPGVEGVTVNLLDGKGTFITDTTTDSKGFYLFDNLNSGDYIVEFVKPDGYSSFSPIDQGGDDALDSDANVFGQTGIINLSNGENDTSVDAGLLPQLYLGDKVWEDLNGNGIQDNGEPGIGGVTVNLLDSNGNNIGNTKTAADGSYKFAVDSGDYSLQFTAPGGYTFTITDAAGSNETNDSDAFFGGGTSTVTITTTDNYDIDAGLYLPASIGNFVWLDANKNGIQDNDESGVSNVTVNLLNSDKSGGGPSAVTNSDGFYEFTNLAPGTYYVQFEQPSGFNGFTTFQTGGNTKIDSDAGTGGLTGAIELSSGENDNTIDAGLLETPPPPTKYNLGDRVWNDLNQNGIQETNEPGIAGITVNLLNSGGTVIGTTTTDSSGFYNFSVDPDTYSVQFAPIATQYGFTLPNVDNKTSNPNDSDSDADPLTGANYGKTETVTITNADNLSLDAGLYIRPTKAEGFTIGYWGKQGIKQGDWGEAGYQTTQNYETVFDVNLSSTLKPSADTNNNGTVTLLEALKASGNTNGENLLRQSTAALLNASHPDVDYYYSVGEVITWTRNAFSTSTTTDDNSLATLFDNANNAGGII